MNKENAQANNKIAITCDGLCGKTIMVKTRKITPAQFYICNTKNTRDKCEASLPPRPNGYIKVITSMAAHDFTGITFKQPSQHELESHNRAKEILAAGLSQVALNNAKKALSPIRKKKKRPCIKEESKLSLQEQFDSSPDKIRFFASLPVDQRASIKCKGITKLRSEVVEFRKNCVMLSEACKLLGCSKYELNKWDENGLLPHVFTKRIQMQKTVTVRFWNKDDISLFSMSKTQDSKTKR